jgi:hypothetical protein
VQEIATNWCWIGYRYRTQESTEKVILKVVEPGFLDMVAFDMVAYL